ncbi:tRNA-uridine aminocarboxypropyltransferase 1-like [Saccoglossus kowalevskii]|uniref:tRNA-uridine aminocarboxypropyltransferase 1 n=1 Tax=Saccoglossus kowalevskii TaxID=10224 RepID=A0ABM0GWI8_SACKO|nr:PREDICTED: DTW domain-containing protein 1-like [Saccoglossus kowalevskii]
MLVGKMLSLKSEEPGQDIDATSKDFVHLTSKANSTVYLPLQVVIIKHPKELEGKSTAVHAAVLAPNDVTIYTYPCIPDFKEKDKVLLVFPSPTALTLDDFAKQSTHESGDESNGPLAKKAKRDVLPVPKFNRVVFIDSTWNQTSSIYRDDKLQGLQCVILKSAKTTFWRKQEKKPDNFLATIEAVYRFMIEYHLLFIDPIYDKRYDNLLYFYSFLHNIVNINVREKRLKEQKKLEKS